MHKIKEMSGGKFFSQIPGLNDDPFNPGWESMSRMLERQLIASGLLEAYDSAYPLVEARELIPSFDASLIEHKQLPAFSVLILNRSLSYVDEIFQFDMLYDEGKPIDYKLRARNLNLLKARLPRNLKPGKVLGTRSVTRLKSYPMLLPLLLKMDRAQVIARNDENKFYLAGIYAAFPSDLDRQLKRMGYGLNKFKKNDNQSYAENRQFVYRFLMEGLGFPISGERHTSAAMFALRLTRNNEEFKIMVLGQSDRVLTILSDSPLNTGRLSLPMVSKVALVSTSSMHSVLQDNGFYLDPSRRVVILKVGYEQHSLYDNTTQAGRALSVLSQEVIHPQSGEIMEFDVLGLSQDKLLMLYSIVRGEFNGSIVYHNSETIYSTKGTARRLKFLSSWLHKHRFIFAEYSAENFSRLNELLSAYLYDSANETIFSRYGNLYLEAHEAWQDLLLAHRLHELERVIEESGLSYANIFVTLNQILSLEGEELARRSPDDLLRLLKMCQKKIRDFKKHALAERDKADAFAQVEMRALRKTVNRYLRGLKLSLAWKTAASIKPGKAEISEPGSAAEA
jgi:hypothetical protein